MLDLRLRMRNAVRVKRVVVLLVLPAVMVGLTGCNDSAGAPSAPTSVPPTEIPTTPTAVPTVVATPAGGITGVVHVRDKDGYTFDITYTYSPHEIERLMANDRPGFSSARIRHGASLAITNTTPGRTLTFNPSTGESFVVLVATWNPESVVCSVMYKSDEIYSTQPGSSEKPCAIWLAYGRVTQPLGPDETLELQVYSGRPNETVTLGPNGGVAGIARVPDVSYEVVSAGLESPDDYFITYIGDDAQRFSAVCSRDYFYGAALSSSSGTRKCPEANNLPQPHSGD